MTGDSDRDGHGTFRIRIEETGECFVCSEGFTVLRGMEYLGKGGIPVGCRRGGCGVCKVEILEGTYRKRVMSRERVSAEDECAHRVLACCIWPTSDLRLRVLGPADTPAACAGSDGRGAADTGTGAAAPDGNETGGRHLRPH